MYVYLVYILLYHDKMLYGLLKIQARNFVWVQNIHTGTHKTINLKSFLTLIGIKFRLQ